MKLFFFPAHLRTALDNTPGMPEMWDQMEVQEGATQTEGKKDTRRC